MDHGVWAACLRPKESQRDRWAEKPWVGCSGGSQRGEPLSSMLFVQMLRDHDGPPLSFRIGQLSFAVVNRVNVQPLDREVHRFG